MPDVSQEMRARLWARFAAGFAMDGASPQACASDADGLLAEFERRYQVDGWGNLVFVAAERTDDPRPGGPE